MYLDLYSYLFQGIPKFLANSEFFGCFCLICMLQETMIFFESKLVVRLGFFNATY